MWVSCRAPRATLARTMMTKTLSHRALIVLLARWSTTSAPHVRCVILARELGTTRAIRKPSAARLVQVSTNASVCMDLRATASGVPHGHSALSAALSKQGSRTPPMTGSAKLSPSAELGNMKRQLQCTRKIVAVKAAPWEPTVHQVNSAVICAPRCTRTTIRIHPRHAKLI
jgi:hypothetical protein